MCAEIGPAPSRRCNHRRWPPSSTMAMDTGHLFFRASVSAAAAMALTSASSRKGFVFMLVTPGAPSITAAPWGIAEAPRGNQTRILSSNSPSSARSFGMNEQVTPAGFGYALPSAQQRNRVMRNTYWLLALSLIPTVLGAWVGVATGITRTMTGGLGLVVFLGGAFAFMFAIEK